MAAILLRELQIEIKRTLTTNALLAVLETKLLRQIMMDDEIAKLMLFHIETKMD